MAPDLPGVTLHHGHVLDVLAGMEMESVSCVVTSPPYWGLRKYSGEQDQVWGGRLNCEHEWNTVSMGRKAGGESYGINPQAGYKDGFRNAQHYVGHEVDETRHEQATCSLCGAWRGALGLEPYPETFIQHLMAVMAALWRVLRRDGVCWVNLDDTRTSGSSNGRGGMTLEGTSQAGRSVARPASLKPKDMALIPERFVLAAQAQGWYVRSKTIWALPNPMPESCKDRPSDAYQVVYMLTKSENYWWDQEAVRETAIHAGRLVKATGGVAQNAQDVNDVNDRRTAVGFTLHDTLVGKNRNLRNVWMFPTRGQGTYRVNGKSLAHFAAFPPELPRRAILASCPPYVCAECGAPWVREVDHKSVYEGARRNDGMEKGGTSAGTGWKGGSNASPTVITLGWSPTCTHPQPEKEFCPPGVVLDPFCGSGTTLIAARQLGRQAIGIDLSPDYIALTRHRLEHVMAPLYPVTEANL